MRASVRGHMIGTVKPNATTKRGSGHELHLPDPPRGPPPLQSRLSRRHEPPRAEEAHRQERERYARPNPQERRHRGEAREG